MAISLKAICDWNHVTRVVKKSILRAFYKEALPLVEIFPIIKWSDLDVSVVWYWDWNCINLKQPPFELSSSTFFFLQVMSKDATASTSALAQIDELIKDKEKVILLGERMDQLLISCYMQYKHVLQNKIRADNANPKEILRLLQVIIGFSSMPNFVRMFWSLS